MDYREIERRLDLFMRRFARMFDPIDGQSVVVAYFVGELLHWLLIRFLPNYQKQTHLGWTEDKFYLWRITIGWMVIAAVLTLPFWFLIGWSSIFLFLLAVCLLLIFAETY